MENRGGGRWTQQGSAEEGPWQAWPPSDFLTEKLKTQDAAELAGRRGKTSSHPGSKRPPTPTEVPRKRTGSQRPRGTQASLWTSNTPLQRLRETSPWPPSQLQGKIMSLGEGLPSTVYKASCFCVCVFCFLHSGLNTVRLRLPPQCLVPPLRHSIRKKNKNVFPPSFHLFPF